MSDSDARKIDLRTLPLQPRRWKFILHALLEQNNYLHASKSKGVSYATMEERRQFMFRTFEFLAHNQTRQYKMDPRSLSGRHLDFLFDEWERRARAGELGPSSIQKYHSFIRTFCTWVGKPGVVKPLEAYFSEPALYMRTYVSKRSKAWSPNGVDVAAVIQEVADHDERVAAQLAMMRTFGLRAKEAVMFRPHVDVVTAAQAGRDASGAMHYVVINRGTKGGRLRYVPADSQEQRAALDRGRRVAGKADESLSDPRYTLVQAIRHQRYVMERMDITKRGLGVTAHGLRHGYAAQRYEAESGVPAPVQSSERAPADVDERARLIVSEELGHSRKQITNVYLGSSRTDPKKSPRRKP